jgi:hypothetical protein
MSLPTSRGSYRDVYDVLDRAMDDKEGVRIHFDKEGDAYYFRLRAHQARKLHRKDNAATYERDHPLHGASPYDQLVVRIVPNGDGAYVYLEKNLVEALGEIESLSELPLIEHRPQLLLEHKRAAEDDGPTHEPEASPVTGLRRRF